MENPRSPAPPGRARLRRAATLLGAAGGAYLLALALVALPPVRAWARLRAGEAVRARVGAVALGEVRFDPLFRVVAGPIALGGEAGRPALTIERVRLRADLLALLRGRLELASVRLHGVRIDAGQPEALRDLLARRATPSGGTLAPSASGRPWPRVHVRGLRISNAARGPEAEAGPFDLDLWPDPDGLRADARLPEGGRVALDLRRGAGIVLALRGAGLHPGALGGLLSRLPVTFPAGALSLEIDATAPADLARVEGHLRAAAEGLVLRGARLSPEPVGPFELAAEGRVSWLGGERRLDLGPTTLSLGGALQATLRATLSLAEDLPFSLSLRASRVPYSAFVAALPTSLAPPPEAPHPPADLDASLSVEGPLLAPGAWRLAAALDLSRMRAAARRAAPVPLREPFRYQPQAGPSFQVGPDNPDFVPLEELPGHVARAVTASEDAGFFAHAGFDFDEMGIALSEGLEAGRVVRGGSTITQQLAKNLWLSRDRVLARKVREALGTVALEATLPKARILEIYLNVAEWGPGVYGIGPAARHWFGKDARQLTAKEAALLASVIPSPVRLDTIRQRGTLGDAWGQRVSEILLHMCEHGDLGDEELLQALDQPLVFAADPPEVMAAPAVAGGG
jgi:hypothetical protein